MSKGLLVLGDLFSSKVFNFARSFSNDLVSSANFDQAFAAGVVYKKKLSANMNSLYAR